MHRVDLCDDANELTQLRAKAALVDELLAAAKLAALNFQRSQASGNFLGDDDHEAWTALRTAIAKFGP